MKFYIHYTIWNKQDHISWICEGIKTAIPKGSIIDFVFDNCNDESINNFYDCKDLNEHGYGSLRGYDVKWFISNKKLRCPNTNDAIERFLKSDCDLFLSPQDDMKIQDKFLCENLIKLYSENTKVGFVGMRDGFAFDGKMYSSCHSHKTPTPTTWLRTGQYIKVKYANDGPICLSKDAINNIGLFDTEYWAHYIDNDYCFRANRLGYNNFVMGAEIVHEKWGKVQQSEVWSQEYSTHDYELYKTKWENEI